MNVSVTPDYRLGVTNGSCLLKRLFIRAFDGIDWLGIDLFFVVVFVRLFLMMEDKNSVGRK